MDKLDRILKTKSEKIVKLIKGCHVNMKSMVEATHIAAFLQEKNNKFSRRIED